MTIFKQAIAAGLMLATILEFGGGIIHGVDFHGYVSLPHYRVLKTRTKRRMVKKIIEIVRLKRSGAISLDTFRQTLVSYAGMLSHCRSEKLKELLRKFILSTDYPELS